MIYFKSILLFFCVYLGILSAQVPVFNENQSFLESWVQVRVPTASIQSHAFDGSKLIFQTPSGSVFQVIQSTIDYYKIFLMDNIYGYIRHEDVFFIQKPDSFIVPILSVGLSQPISYQYAYFENFIFPRKNMSQYFDLDIKGFHEYKISGRDFSPKDPNDPRFDMIKSDPFYSKLPRDVLPGPTKQDIRFRYNIDGQLDKHLFVHYDIEQEPDFPGKYDVKITHKQKELQFGHLNAAIQNGNYLNINKSLNGVKGSINDPQGSAIIANGKERSDAQAVTFFGDNKLKYSLKNKYVLKGSISVFVNHQKQTENQDYTINYFEGYILFTEPKTSNDFIKVIYESSNPIMDFLPMLSRKQFFGIQAKYDREDRTIFEKLSEVKTDVIINTSNENIYTVSLSNTDILLGSDQVYLNSHLLIRNKDYLEKCGYKYDGKQWTKQ